MSDEMEPTAAENAAQQPDNSAAYTADKITVLEGLEAVRKRPAMYIGDTAENGLHHLVYEVVDNSIDEALAGYASHVEVTIHPDNSVTVKDDGRGVPVDIHKDLGIPAVEVVMTVLHAGGKFDHNSYKVSGGLHGVGVSCVNALSDWMEVEVHRGGMSYNIRFERGVTVRKLAPLHPVSDRGTTVTFHPDKDIFVETTIYKWDRLAARLRELAFLNRGVRITLTDEREEPVRTESFFFEGGICEFVKHLNANKQLVHPDVIYMTKEKNGLVVEVALQYNTDYQTQIYSYANNINTHEGGTHLIGFQSALTRTVNAYAKAQNMLKGDKAIRGEDTREGLSAIISVKVPDPQFEGQTKTKLGNSEVKGVVETIVNDALGTFFEEHPNDAKMIIEKNLLASHAREQAAKAREQVRKGALNGFSLPGKLMDCAERDPSKAEIFIVEGNSAGGTAKGGRDPKYQAILPLRGKILNVEKAQIHKILENKEIQSLIASIGCGIGEEDFDEAKLRYHRIVIMTDADVDGSHIATLLLTFFYRQMKPLIEKGYIYLAKPPLYKVTRKKNERYIDSDEQLDRYLITLGNEDLEVKWAGTGEVLSAEEIAKVSSYVTRTQQVTQGLHRHGVDPNQYMSMERDGKFPTELVIVHETDGSVTESLLFSKEEESELLAEAEKRLPPMILPEGTDPEAPKPIHPAIDIIQLFEARDCMELGDEIRAAGCDPKTVLHGTEPLFIIRRKTSGEEETVNSMLELFESIKNNGREGLKIQRYKGLGEMNAEQLWSTTMNPETRKMIKVTMEDAVEAERIFTLLMGDAVEPRREYIERHAAGVKDLDI
ncbi:MAG: DNA topoisomerase (ATP-hydrolyzing) subunit B [Lentisphaeria bacterium]|nr:DNA topoisomerase (ATP-hydrolyzing) subunit B [Lentisphaeria bacterium]